MMLHLLWLALSMSEAVIPVDIRPSSIRDGGSAVYSSWVSGLRISDGRSVVHSSWVSEMRIEPGITVMIHTTGHHGSMADWYLLRIDGQGAYALRKTGKH